jgi:hypothetical protein
MDPPRAFNSAGCSCCGGLTVTEELAARRVEDVHPFDGEGRATIVNSAVSVGLFQEQSRMITCTKCRLTVL